MSLIIAKLMIFATNPVLSYFRGKYNFLCKLIFFYQIIFLRVIFLNAEQSLSLNYFTEPFSKFFFDMLNFNFQLIFTRFIDLLSY